MAGIFNGGDDDGVEEGPSNNHGPLRKKPRASYSSRMSDSDVGNPNSYSPESSVHEDNPGATQDECEELIEDESGTAFYDSPDAVPSEEEEEYAARGETQTSIYVTLTDPDVLDCEICLEPLSSPVYQCKNGHIACASCCTKMRNKCASCYMPIGYNRCRAIEKVLESIEISCPYKCHGCKESLRYSEKLDHKKTCTYTPCSCPYPGCNYVGPSKRLYAHFTQRHSTFSTKFRYSSMFSISLDTNHKHVFLQESKKSVLFILNRTIEPLGSCVSVFCIGPSSLKKGFRYTVKTSHEESSIMLRTVIESTPEWIEDHPAKKCLVVPKDFMSSNGQLKLELWIYWDH